MNKKHSKAPTRLSTEAKRWWESITKDYDINDEAGFLLLQTALEAFDRMRDAQRIVKQDGESIMDRFEQIKAHPMLAIERDSRGQMLTALKALNLDLEPLRDGPGRPGGK